MAQVSGGNTMTVDLHTLGTIDIGQYVLLMFIVIRIRANSCSIISAPKFELTLIRPGTVTVQDNELTSAAESRNTANDYTAPDSDDDSHEDSKGEYVKT